MSTAGIVLYPTQAFDIPIATFNFICWLMGIFISIYMHHISPSIFNRFLIISTSLLLISAAAGLVQFLTADSDENTRALAKLIRDLAFTSGLSVDALLVLNRYGLIDATNGTYNSRIKPALMSLITLTFFAHFLGVLAGFAYSRWSGLVVYPLVGGIEVGICYGVLKRLTHFIKVRSMAKSDGDQTLTEIRKRIIIILGIISLLVICSFVVFLALERPLGAAVVTSLSALIGLLILYYYHQLGLIIGIMKQLTPVPSSILSTNAY